MQPFCEKNLANLRVREIVESSVNSAELWNRWLFESLREKGLYFWQKPKVTKTF